MSGEDIFWLEIHELSERIGEGELSPVEVVEALLRRIDSINPRILGFLEVTADSALAEAKRAEEEIAAGRRLGPLHGIPFGVKDIIDTRGVRTTRGSSFFRDRIPEADAECVARLKRAGAILLGKCHTQEFASGPLSQNAHFGTAHNPWDLERMTGGSSTGSAASVAAGFCPAAIGTDTGSSIRGPSSLCGLVGLKPTHGRVSLRGVCPNCLSYDHVGPIARSAKDAALFLQGMAGYDPEDPYSRDAPLPDFSALLDEGAKGLRVGLCPGLSGDFEADAEVAQAFERAVGVFREMGAQVETLPFGEAEHLMEVSRVIIQCEFAEFHRPLYEKNPDGYGGSTRERVEASLAGANLDEYIRAGREREVLRREVLSLFERTDVILTPSIPCIAPRLDDIKARINGEEVAYSLALTMPFLTHQNLTGFPAAVVPTGFSEEEGMPLSLQVIGRPWEEAEVLRAVHAYEAATPELRNRRPAL